MVPDFYMLTALLANTTLEHLIPRPLLGMARSEYNADRCCVQLPQPPPMHSLPMLTPFDSMWRRHISRAHPPTKHAHTKHTQLQSCAPSMWVCRRHGHQRHPKLYSEAAVIPPLTLRTPRHTPVCSHGLKCVIGKYTARLYHLVHKARCVFYLTFAVSVMHLHSVYNYNMYSSYIKPPPQVWSRYQAI